MDDPSQVSLLLTVPIYAKKKYKMIPNGPSVLMLVTAMQVHIITSSTPQVANAEEEMLRYSHSIPI